LVAKPMQSRAGAPGIATARLFGTSHEGLRPKHTRRRASSRRIEHPDPMSMCRCGHSSNKPFCDGTHATIDFDGSLAN
jgi:CDGSH-type Zn-finger protein